MAPIQLSLYESEVMTKAMELGELIVSLEKEINDKQLTGIINNNKSNCDLKYNKYNISTGSNSSSESFSKSHSRSNSKSSDTNLVSNSNRSTTSLHSNGGLSTNDYRAFEKFLRDKKKRREFGKFLKGMYYLIMLRLNV